MRKLVAGLSGAIAMLWGGEALSAIAYTQLGVSERFYQSSGTAVTSLGASIFAGLAVQSPTDFTSASVTFPGASSPQALNYNPTLLSNGAYGGIGTSRSFSTVSDLNASYPFGTYSFTAVNSTTGASETSSLTYDRNHWPDTVPMMTEDGYNSLQGLKASEGGAFHFKSFEGDGFWPFGGSGQESINPFTTLTLYKLDGTPVYTTGRLENESTSFVLPPEVLAPSTTYLYGLSYGNNLHLQDPGQKGYALSNSYQTFGYFVTAAEDTFAKTLVDLQGGTFDNPVALPVVGRIGELTGSIGGIGDSDFYQFFWQGGLFASSVRLTGADPDAKFLFQLYDKDLTLLRDIPLTSGNDFEATLTEFLPRGLFTIGLLATHPLDPEFKITFITPVGGGAVPEPSSWALMILGFGLAGAGLRARKTVFTTARPR